MCWVYVGMNTGVLACHRRIKCQMKIGLPRDGSRATWKCQQTPTSAGEICKAIVRHACGQVSAFCHCRLKVHGVFSRSETRKIRQHPSWLFSKVSAWLPPVSQPAIFQEKCWSSGPKSASERGRTYVVEQMAQACRLLCLPLPLWWIKERRQDKPA